MILIQKRLEVLMASYADNALDYNAVGICPLPVKDKRPLIRGFNSWKGLSNDFIEYSSSRFPDASVSILTRLSGLVVVDIDSQEPDLFEWCLNECGHTPLIVKTRKGYHLYYGNKDGTIKGSIRAGKYPIDVKANGRSDYVVAPPSDGYEFQEVTIGNRLYHTKYDFLELLQKGLPEIDKKGLDIILEPQHTQNSNDNSIVTIIEPSQVSQYSPNKSYGVTNEVPEGERNSFLWQLGMGLSAKIANKKGICIDAFGEFETQLLETNQGACQPPLPTKEVKRISANIWNNYQTKGKNNFGVPHKAFMSEVLLSVAGVEEISKNPKGMALLIWLKSHYDNKTEFLLNVPKLRNYLGWSEYQTKQAKKYLISKRFIQKMSPSNFTSRIAAKFRFTISSNQFFSPIPNTRVIHDNLI